MSMAISANFAIDIGGVAIPTVAEVSAPSLEIDIVEHKDVNDKGLYVIHRVPGKYKAGNITVTRQLKAGELGFEQWLLATWQGSPVGKSIGLTYKDSAGQTVREVNFNFGMIKSVEISNLKAGEITLTRAMRKDEDDFATWFKLGFLGDLGSAGKGGSIVVMDPTNAVEVRRYDIAGAFPKKLEFGQMKAGDTSVVTEKLTLVHSGISSPATKLGLSG